MVGAATGRQLGRVAVVDHRAGLRRASTRGDRRPRRRHHRGHLATPSVWNTTIDSLARGARGASSVGDPMATQGAGPDPQRMLTALREHSDRYIRLAQIGVADSWTRARKEDEEMFDALRRATRPPSCIRCPGILPARR